MSEVICVGCDEAANKRVQKATQFLDISVEFVSAAGDLMDRYQELQPRFIIISSINKEAKEEISGEVQALRQMFKDIFILVIAQKKLPPADASFVKKSGCNYVLLEHEFLSTIRLEYVLLQTVKAAYVPVKVSDFKANSTLDFFVYTIMPLNKKILPVLQPGTSISQSRIDKLNTVGELYVKRGEIDSYNRYVQAHEDKSANGLISRCRAQFYTVSFAHANLLFLLTDQAEAASFDKGKDLLSKCLELSRDLLTTLAVIPEPWNVLDQSAFGMIGGTDRAMMIASMAALTSFAIDKGAPEDVMLAGLFCDMGLLDLSPDCIGKIDSIEGRSQLSPEDDIVLKKHPVLSLNRLLDRKLQVPENVKEIILCTHEQVDKQGYPRRPLAEKIPFEAALIFFHELVDLEFRVKFGRKRETYPEVKKRVFEKESQELKKFNLVFLETLRKSL